MVGWCLTGGKEEEEESSERPGRDSRTHGSTDPWIHGSGKKEKGDSEEEQEQLQQKLVGSKRPDPTHLLLGDVRHQCRAPGVPSPDHPLNQPRPRIQPPRLLHQRHHRQTVQERPAGPLADLPQEVVGGGVAVVVAQLAEALHAEAKVAGLVVGHPGKVPGKEETPGIRMRMTHRMTPRRAELGGGGAVAGERVPRQVDGVELHVGQHVQGVGRGRQGGLPRLRDRPLGNQEREGGPSWAGFKLEAEAEAEGEAAGEEGGHGGVGPGALLERVTA